MGLNSIDGRDVAAYRQVPPTEAEFVRLTAAQGSREHRTRLVHSRRRQARERTPKGVRSKGVQIVEAGHTFLGHSVLWTQGQLTAQSADRARTGGDDDRADSLRDRISGEDEHRSITSRG
jgi:hypothetical protein